MLRIAPLAFAASLGLAGLALAEEPRHGGQLNFTAPYGASFATLDAHATGDLQEFFVTSAIHRPLYTWDSLGNAPVLELADSVEASEDGLTFTYHLKKNAVFHNDKPLTADDVIFSYKRIVEPGSAFLGSSYILTIKGAQDYMDGKTTEIEGLEKIDDNTVSITFNSALDPGFVLMQNETMIMPSNVDPAQQGIQPVGIGPFKFKSHTPGSEVEVERFDKFYKEGKPYLDRVRIIVMPDDSTRNVAFRNKEIDTSILGPVQYQEYQADEALKGHLLDVAEVFTRNIGFSKDFEPFKDKRVRQAINYAIDSQLIIDKLMRGKAIRATGWLPVSSPAFDPAAEPYAYDPEKAKALLAEAGYADGFTFEVTATPNESWGVPVVEAILPMLAKVGITVKPRPVESGALSAEVSSGNFQAFIWSNYSGPDPLTVLRCFTTESPQAGCNNTAYSNPEYDAIFKAAEAERDPAKRLDLLRQANNFLQDDAPVWFFNYNKAVMAYQPWVHGLVPNATELALQPYEDIWIDESAPADRQ